MFSYSGRVKSPEWRWQRRRADLQHFEIFRHRPIIIYTRLPAGGTYYPICTFPASSECLISISDAFSAFCLCVSVISPTCLMYPLQKPCLLCATPTGMDLYIQVHARRLLTSAFPWISEDRLLVGGNVWPAIVLTLWHCMPPSGISTTKGACTELPTHYILVIVYIAQGHRTMLMIMSLHSSPLKNNCLLHQMCQQQATRVPFSSHGVGRATANRHLRFKPADQS